MTLKATSKFRLSAWLRRNFLQMEHYFSSDEVFPLMKSLNDDITVSLHCIIRKHFYYIIKFLFLKSQTYTVNDVFVVITN